MIRLHRVMKEQMAGWSVSSSAVYEHAKKIKRERGEKMGEKQEEKQKEDE